MPLGINPTIVMYRLRQDAFRLHQWALKSGTDEQQKKAVQLIKAIEFIAPLFGADKYKQELTPRNPDFKLRG